MNSSSIVVTFCYKSELTSQILFGFDTKYQTALHIFDLSKQCSVFKGLPSYQRSNCSVTTFKVYHVVNFVSTSFFNILNIYSTLRTQWISDKTRFDNINHSISCCLTRQVLISNLYDYSTICYLCISRLKQQQVISYQSSPARSRGKTQ